MDENLLGYLLNALDPDEHRAVEAYLEANPAAREQLEGLRRGLEPLALDLDSPEPPPGLAVRTLGRIAEYTCRELPRAPVTRDGAGGATIPFWRRADVLVAACLLITALGLLLPWINSLIGPGGSAHVVACQENLRRFYVGLKNYSEAHGNRFPDVAAAQAPRRVAGLVVPILKEAQTLPESVSVRCPANGAAQPCTWALRDLNNLPPDEFDRQVPLLFTCYAYSLGHQVNGTVHGPRFDRDRPNSRLPLLADCPPVDPLAGNSPNHGGKGQNVLFYDGHVEFCTARNVGVGRDDIFVNRAGKVAAGDGRDDSVLGRSSASPLP
jgi:prepilin-type processing-associated H-X9-DG protein